MIPKGKLLIIGGHEDKGEPKGQNLDIQKRNVHQTHFEILGAMISKIPRAHHIIEIIAAASSIPAEVEEMYVECYKLQGFTQVGIIKVGSKVDAENLISIKRIQGAHAVFFTGGDQNKLVSVMEHSTMLKAIRNKYYSDEHFIVGGTSAGAMAIPEVIIDHGLIAEALYTDDLLMGKGLDVIQNIIVDTHFIKRGRFARLAHAVLLNPTCLGIGLGEDTALIISKGIHAQCIGSGMVIVIDGSKITSNCLHHVMDNGAITIENLNVSILAEGSGYSLTERKCIEENSFVC